MRTFVSMQQPVDITDVLRRYWGYSEFRSVQERIIRAVLDGRDTLALMPTGGGKSLTYQVPTMAREGLCIVVTPLIALMKDQVDRLRSLRIPAVAIHSGLSPRQLDIALDNCVYGDVKFLYVAPERLASEAFRLRVVRMNVSLIAVDEAHCISQWGYDFRPSYLRIAELREKLPGVPVLALTASATERVAEDIQFHLKFAEQHVVRGDFRRPNLSYSVRHTDDKNEQLMRLLQHVAGSGIVYMRTREGTEQLAATLCDAGISAAAYHGGLGHAERAARQEDWLRGKVRVMVATNAFGMGVDKPDVRFVVHYSMCDSLESYYQEAGRAGRDGLRAYALLLVASDDADRITRRFRQEFPPLEQVKEIYERVCSYMQIGIGDGAGASMLFNIYDFCAREHLYAGTVQSALKLLEQNGYLTLTDVRDNPARVMFCVSRDDLYKLRVRRDDLDHFIRTLLRLYNGVLPISGLLTNMNWLRGAVTPWSGSRSCSNDCGSCALSATFRRIVRRCSTSMRSVCRVPISTSRPRPMRGGWSLRANVSSICSPMRRTMRGVGASCWMNISVDAMPSRAVSAMFVWPVAARRNAVSQRTGQVQRTGRRMMVRAV